MATWLIDKPEQLTLDGDVTQLDVWLAHGKLRVVGTEGPARLDVRKVGRRGLTVTLENGALSVSHPIRLGWWHLWWFGSGKRNYTADVTIAVPPSARSSLTLMSGNLVASGLRSGATTHVTSGQITLMGLGGTVRAKTISGAIQAMGIGGDLGMETVSGEISLAESPAERVWARTISGSVTCDLDNPHASDVRIDTTSGSITVRVPTDADLDVNVAATSGRVTSAFPQVRPSNLPGHKSAQGRIGAGSGTLRAYAVSGSVALLAAPSHEDER
jgi:Putative adhesin